MGLCSNDYELNKLSYFTGDCQCMLSVFVMTDLTIGKIQKTSPFSQTLPSPGILQMSLGNVKMQFGDFHCGRLQAPESSTMNESINPYSINYDLAWEMILI